MEFLKKNLEKKLDKYWHIPPNFSATSGPIFTELLVVIYVRIIKLALVLWSLKGHCYGNELIYGLFADVEIDCFHSLLWHSETEGTIAL